MDGIAAWASQLQWGRLTELLITAAAALLCISVHESCHGLSAWILGDPTARRQGRITLNPLKHIDPAGLFMMVVARFGWAKPVPINPGYFKNPRVGMAVTALAGPLSNVLLSALAAVGYTVSIFYALYFQSQLLQTVSVFCDLVFILSAGLAVFNLLPIPPLDGSKVLFSVLPDELYWKLMRYERYGMVALMVLLLTGVLDIPLNYLRESLFELLWPIAEWTMELLMTIHT